MKKIITTFCIAFSAITFAQVGISETVNFEPNTNVEGDIVNSDSSPVMLDVDGKTRVRTMPVASPNTYSQVVRNNNSGILEVLPNNAAVKPFNYVTYTITNPDQDWVRALNTQIDATKFSMAIVGHRLINPNSTGNGFINVARGTAYNARVPSGQHGASYDNSDIAVDNQEGTGWDNWDILVAANVYADVNSSNQWEIHADYGGGGTKFWGDSTWYITVLIIDNAFANVLGNVNVNLGGNSTGTAPLPANLTSQN